MVAAGSHGRLAHQGVDDGLLEAGGKVRHGACIGVLGAAQEGGLQPGEAEVEAVTHARPGEALGAGGLPGDALDLGPAGEAQTQDAGGLVEGLAGGVVAGPAQELVVASAPHEDQVRVAPGGDEAEKGQARLVHGGGALLQPGGVDVSLQVVYAQEGDPQGQGEALGEVGAHQEGAGQARAHGHSHGVQLAGGHVRLGQGTAVDGDHGQDVLPGSHLRDDAPVAGVDLHLGADDAGEETAAVLDDADGGLVAGGLDAQDAHGRLRPLGARDCGGPAAAGEAPCHCSNPHASAGRPGLPGQPLAGRSRACSAGRLVGP